MATLLTIISRASDGLVLSEGWDMADTQGSMASHKSEAKKILSRLSHGPNRCSVDASDVTFHYQIESGVTILTLTPRSFPKRIAFAFLDDLMRAFMEQVKQGVPGNASISGFIEGITKPYYFIQFERVIMKKRNEFKEPNGQAAMGRVNEGLVEINNIMRQSLDEMLQRGEALEDVGRRADDLKEASKRFAKQANYLNIQAMMRKYGTLGFLIFCFLFIIWLRFF